MVMNQRFAAAELSDLANVLGDRLIRVQSVTVSALTDGEGPESSGLANPFFLEDQPGGFHTTGWFGAYDSAPSS